jgi:hypothetical protein
MAGLFLPSPIAMLFLVSVLDRIERRLSARQPMAGRREQPRRAA